MVVIDGLVVLCFVVVIIILARTASGMVAPTEVATMDSVIIIVLKIVVY